MVAVSSWTVSNKSPSTELKLFGAEHANVQPHSGSQANMGAYLAALQPGDTIMGMDLSHGGHLTHGSPVNFSGILFRVVSYGLDPETGRLNYNIILDAAKNTARPFSLRATVPTHDSWTSKPFAILPTK